MVTKPTVGGSVGTWGQENNDALDDLQTQIDAVAPTVTDEAARAVAAEDAEAARAVAAEDAVSAALTVHAADTTDVHGITDTTDLATQTQFDALQASVVGAIGYDPDETIFTDDERYYRGSIWRAKQDLPGGIAPLGLGDGTAADQTLLLGQRVGFASWVTGGEGGTVLTVHNANDAGSGSLRQAILDHLAANAADSGRKTWIIFDKTFNLVADVPTYAITLASNLIIAGAGAHNLTIDCRGAAVTINGAGSPGVTGVGTVGYRVNIGGVQYSDFTRGSNTAPASNIIIHGLAIISNWGGENTNTGTHGDLEISYWARGIWVDHCEVANPDPNHDGLFDIGYGSTEITISWCYLRDHHKALLVNGSSDPGDTGGLTLPPGVTQGSPGPYEIVLKPVTNVPHTLLKVTYVHNYKQNLGLRAPFAKGDPCRVHCYNEYLDGYGGYKDAFDVLTYYPDFTPGTANSGSGWQTGTDAHMVLQNVVANPFPGTTINPPLKRAAYPAASGANGPMRVEGFLGLNGADYNDGDGDGSSGGVNAHPERAFNPSTYYGYTLDDTASLPARVTLAAGPTSTALWEYVGPGTINTTIDVKNEGSLLGAATQVDYVGAGVAATWDGVNKATVTVNAGAADPTEFLRSGTNLPTPDDTQDADYFFEIATQQLFQCKFVSGPNTWQWLPRAAAVTPAVIPGQELVHIAYHPTSTQTAASTTSTTAVDISASAITAAWTGVSAATFDATFTTPPNRVVVVEVELCWSIVSSKKGYIALYNVGGAAAITNTQSIVSSSASQIRCVYRKRLDSTVLPTAGTSFTVRPRWLVESGGTPTAVVGGTNGPFRVRVFASL